MQPPRLITPETPQPPTVDDKKIDVRFTSGEDVVVFLNGDALRPRHLFMAAAILTRLANRMIDAAEMQGIADKMASDAITAQLRTERTQ